MLAAIKESHGRVDRLYELEAKLPDANAEPPKDPDKDVEEFGLERCRVGARFAATLWYAAWMQSAKVKLPEWHKVGVPGDSAAPAPARKEPVGAEVD